MSDEPKFYITKEFAKKLQNAGIEIKSDDVIFNERKITGLWDDFITLVKNSNGERPRNRSKRYYRE